jgi:hypothetical protein
LSAKNKHSQHLSYSAALFQGALSAVLDRMVGQGDVNFRQGQTFTEWNDFVCSLFLRDSVSCLDLAEMMAGGL